MTDEKMAVFHSRVGSLVVLSNENRTAQRNHPTQEFNNGVVLGAEPLRDNQLFEVKIDKKVISRLIVRAGIQFRYSLIRLLPTILGSYCLLALPVLGPCLQIDY